MFETTYFLFTAETTPEVTTDLAESVGKVEELGVAVKAIADPKTKAFFTLELSNSKGGAVNLVSFIYLPKN